MKPRSCAKTSTSLIGGTAIAACEGLSGFYRTLAEQFGRHRSCRIHLLWLDDRVIAAVREAGYRSATSTEPGLARPSDRWSLDRIRIELGDGAAELESKLDSAGA